MKKNTLNYWIDIIMFILMMAIIGIGFLMKFVLITGQERWVRYGSNVDIFFMGMDRHEWGRTHLILGLSFLAVLILHLILHWNSIVRFFQRAILNRLLRFTVVSILVLAGTLLLIFPFLVEYEVSEPEKGSGYGQLHVEGRAGDTSFSHVPRRFEQARPGQGPGRGLGRGPGMEYRDYQDNHVIPDTDLAPDTDVAPDTVYIHEGTHEEGQHQRRELLDDIDVQGYMTLKEVSTQYNVPADQIKERLGIPLSTSDNERLGRLRRLHGFSMSDVREIIYSELNNQLK